MAKKGNEEAPIKKKKHGCRNCLLATLILFVIFNVAVFFTGNYFTKKYLNVSLMDCFKILYDVRHADGKKIVTNGYSNTDYITFETELKNGLFLKEDAEFSLDELIDALLQSSDEGSEDGGAKSVQANGFLARATGVYNASVNTDAFLEKLSDVFVRGNMDMERLRAYDESKHNEYVLSISDKMLAAAIGRSFDTLGENVDKIGDILSDYSLGKLSDIARLEQITFSQKQGTKGGESATVKTVKLTLSVDARVVGQAALKKATGKSLKFATKMFLPKRFYVTAEVAAEPDAAIDGVLYLNNMNDTKMNRAYKLINGIMRRTGSTEDVREKILKAVNENVSDVIEKVDRVFPLSQAENGKVAFDAFETVIDLTDLNEENGTPKPEDEQIHAPDLIKTLAGVVASDAEDGIKPEYDFNHQYYDSAEDKVVYVKTTPAAGLTWVDYKQAFMDELERKYMLDFSRGTPDNTEDDVTFDDLMRLFGLGEPDGASETGEPLELMDILNGRNLHELENEPNKQAVIDSRMLGAILQSQINSLVKGEGTLSTLNPALEYVYTFIKDGHNMMEAALSIDVSSLLSGGSHVEKIVQGLLGERALLTLTVDVTPRKDGEEFVYFESAISYNGLTAEKTDDILKTITVFVKDFSRAELLAQIEQPVRDVIGNMNEKIPVRLCSSVIDVDATSKNLPAAVELGSAFEVIKEMVLKEDDVTAEDIEAVLTKMEASDSKNHDGFESAIVGDGAISTAENSDGTSGYSYSESLQNVLNAYYVNNADTYETFDAVFGESGVINKANFDAAKFNFSGSAPKGLFYDNNPQKPQFTQGDLAALLLEKMTADDSATGSLKLYEYLKKIKGMKIASNKTIELIMELDAEDVLAADLQDKAALLPADKVYLVATVTVGDLHYYNQSTGADCAIGDAGATAYYETKFTVNDMTDAEYAKFLVIVNSLNEKRTEQPIDFDAKARDVGAIVYRELNRVEESLGGAIKYGDGYVELPSAFEFIGRSVLPASSTASGDDVRAALQGLTAKRSEGESVHNYNASQFTVNPIQSEEIVLPASAVADRQTLNDNAFGKALQSGFAIQAGTTVTVGGVLPDTAAYGLSQLNVLAASDERAASRRAYLNGYNDITLSDSDTYLEFTFTVHLKELAAEGSKLLSVLPSDAYMTLLFKKTATGIEPCSGYYRLNEMSFASLSLLLDMANIDEADIDAQITRCTTAMAQYSGVDLSAPVSPVGTAFGSVSFVPPTTTG